MQYAPLGKTGLRVSRLGFGAMRLPMTGDGDQATVDTDVAIAMIHRAFAAGVNYIDTAVGYCNGDSQRVVGEAVRTWGRPIVVSTKNPCFTRDESEWWRTLEQSLERLGLPRIDVYHHHAVNGVSFDEFVLPHMAAWMRKAKDQGLIKHIACSFHDTNDVLRRIVDSGYPEVITVQYNLLDRRLEDGIAYAHERGIGVVVMGPVGGGRLGVADSAALLSAAPSAARRVPELALRFVLSNPAVDVALSGMSAMAHVEENVCVASDARLLTPEEQQAICGQLERLRKMSELYCTGCGYCLPCPKGVAIPKIFERYNLGRVWGLWGPARQAYRNLGTLAWDPGSRADACSDCGLCESKCPQKIPIRRQLKEAHEALLDSKNT